MPLLDFYSLDNTESDISIYKISEEVDSDVITRFMSDAKKEVHAVIDGYHDSFKEKAEKELYKQLKKKYGK